MNKVLTITLLILLLAIPLINEDRDSRYDNWSKNFLCPVCQGENISDSPSEYADDMRMILREQIDSGLSDEEIYNYWVVRYGERIITNPQRTNIEMIPTINGAIIPRKISMANCSNPPTINPHVPIQNTVIYIKNLTGGTIIYAKQFLLIHRSQ